MITKPDKAKQYNRIKLRLKFLDIFFIIAYLVIFQFLLSAKLSNFSTSLTSSPYGALTIYLGIFSILYYLLNLPLSAYSSFIIEHRFGLSNQSFTNWIKDDLKGNALSFLMFFGFVVALYFLLRNFQTTWWVYLAAFWFCFTIGIARVAPIIILPLFFKYSRNAGEYA